MKLRKIVITTCIGLLFPWIGATLNRHVESVNDGKMPVWTYSGDMTFSFLFDPIHKTLTTDTKDKIIADVIPVYALHHGQLEVAEMMSIGDVFIETGELAIIAAEFMWILWVVSLLRPRRKKQHYVIYLR